MKMVYFDMTLDKIRPNSNSKIIGSAKNICDKTSGGVRIAARINEYFMATLTLTTILMMLLLMMLLLMTLLLMTHA